MTMLSLFIILISAFFVQNFQSNSLDLYYDEKVYWISSSKPPCLHPGQPIFEWPTDPRCSQYHTVHSDQISVDESGWIYAKQKLCFYFTFVLIDYSIECEHKQFSGRFKIGHPMFSKSQRYKRWIRRRNPDPNTILFKQSSYIRELLESAAPGTLVETVNATHVAGQPIYYSLAIPQDSRSQNMFFLDTITGEIRLAKSLDREVLDKHVLKVTAYERLDRTVSSSATVIVNVLDVQDNYPVFERDSYFADIREDAPVRIQFSTIFFLLIPLRPKIQ
ncbi:cadherin domain protein [Dictyocaulus viviparus]|uniref:Cadherin domain protein n=1 Tax=Dictyocaulus viviparus TaxID=29172 RepID=A0A0D8XTL5_DICVI|nr:cadherin domain protein [Dictyocaulus viviparus]